ncbi:MAG: YajQ family cyclic di-GMP-binding protein [Armatimonadetes bacterium]|nr:YajQ family cyclic di-GMP-binding protein [Armatimonadota bacterium]MBS1726469.1 YajQ family cyclic di-GMP-binding protein [Armatimonadota bacterium]
MAADFSFDIVSKVDPMEIKNAMDQADKELSNRYDFKGTKAELIFDGKLDIVLVADDEFRMEQLKDIVFSKMLKRGIDARQIEWGKVEPSGNMTVRCKLNLKQGISQDKAKALTKQIRDKGLKVNAQIQGEEVRVSGKSKDDLQKTIQFVKGLDLDYPVDFINFR